MGKRVCPRCNGTGIEGWREVPDYEKGPRRDPLAVLNPKYRFDMKREPMRCSLCLGTGYIGD